MKKRLLAFCLTLCLLVGLLPTAVLAAGDTWTDEVTEKPEGYTVEHSGDVTISSAEGLAWLAQQVNKGTPFSGKTITLSKSIDLSGHEWVPIGTQAKPFSGTFDGGNHTISGMKITVSESNTLAGLFGRVSNAVIQNVVLKEAAVSGHVNGEPDPNTNYDRFTGIYIGGVAAALKDMSSSASNTISITNCRVDLNVDITTKNGVIANIGGILGWTDEWSGSKAIISASNADATVTHRAPDGFYRCAIGGAIGEMNTRRGTNSSVSEGSFSLKATLIGDGIMSGGDFNKSITIGGVSGYTPSAMTSVQEGYTVSLNKISCQVEADLSETTGLLPSVADIGGVFGRGTRYQVKDVFSQIELIGNETEQPYHFGNLAGYTPNDEILCERVYTYALRHQGSFSYENEALSKDSNSGVMPDYPLTDVYYIEPQTLTENEEGVPFLYKTFHNSHHVTEYINDGFAYSDGDTSDGINVVPSADWTKVSVSPWSNACAVHGEQRFANGFTVAFTLPIVVEPAGAAPKYQITTRRTGTYSGKVETFPADEARAGEEVMIKTTCENGVLDSLTVITEGGISIQPTRIDGTSHLGNHTYKFQMPEDNVTVTAAFRAKKKEITVLPSTNVDFGTVTEGYSRPAAQTVTLKNTGETRVSITLSGTTRSFDIEPQGEGWTSTSRGDQIWIEVGQTATFTVQPKEGLPVGNYSERITLNYIYINVNFKLKVVPTPTYGMTATPDTLSFEPLYEGYTAPSGQTVTLTNTGTGTLNVTLPTSEHFTITPDASWNNGAVSLAPNGTATVTVTPKQGLTAGDYRDSIRFDTDQSGICSEVMASFSVTSCGEVLITPASITVYTGGEGYTGVVNDQGQSTTTTNGLPQPGYYITLPEELNRLLGDNTNAEDLSQILTFNYRDEQGRTRRWTLEPYGTDEHSTNVEVGGVRTARYIYRLSPGLDENGTEIPVRLQLTDGNTVIFKDDFTPSLKVQYQKFTMNLYSGDLHPEKITASLTLPNGQTVTCGVKSTSGELVVRGLNNKDAVTDIADDESELSGQQITAVAPDDITYYVNGSNVELANCEGVKLLVDDVLDDGVLVNYIQTKMTEEIPAGDYTYAQQYLDLVDTKNGNAYLTIDADAGQKMAIYWRAPEDLDENGRFYVVHFQALHRNYDNMDAELSAVPPMITPASLMEIGGIRYVRFETSSFSPFVLMWETKGTTPTTVQLTYKANGGTGEDQITYYTLDDVVTVSDNLWFTRKKHTFDGWNTRADGSGTKYMPGRTILMNGNIDLYAQWIKEDSGDPDPGDGDSHGGDATAQEFELHYRTNGGKYLSVESESYVWTKAYEELPVPVREGYSFEGWYWDFRLTDPVRSDVKVDSPVVVLYAKWTEEKDASDLTGVSNWLDTIHHKAFLSGYPDGTFGPDRNMTRAEVAQMFYALLLDKDVKITKTFTDVPADAWYAKAVNTLASLGMLGGYPDGTFQPDRTITRAEFAVVALAFTDGGSGASCSFTDVNRSDWFYQYAAQANEYGWIGGYPDGSFRPNNKITRAEVSVIVNNMLGRDADERFIDRNGDELVSFTDLTDGHWAYYAIMEATNTHTYTRDGSTEVWKAAT